MAKTIIDQLIVLSKTDSIDLTEFQHVLTNKTTMAIYDEYLKERKALADKYWTVISKISEEDKKSLDSLFTNDEKFKITFIYDHRMKANL